MDDLRQRSAVFADRGLFLLRREGFGAFGKIVSSIVDDIIMPPIGWLIGGVNFTDLKFTLPQVEIPGVETMAAATIKYGNFIQTLLDFVIIAFCVFMLVKFINKLARKQ